MTGAAALLLAAHVVAAPQDRDYRAGLDLVYDGRPTEALARLGELATSHAEDPVPLYLQALALAWVVEQRPDSTVHDPEFVQAADRAWTFADARLRADPDDARARFARGATSGVRSRYHLFRLHRGEAARAAAQMRADLLLARALDPGNAEVLFGLGLYDYYADALSRFARVVRFLSGLPGGNRARGLAAVEEAARAATLHDVEARVQLYQIRAFYEDDPEGALVSIEEMQSGHPAWPLWGLLRAEHLRDRLGAYAESAEVARALLADGLAGGPAGAPDPGPGATALARLSLARSLLLDLDPRGARDALLPLAPGVPGFPTVDAEARLLLGRALELGGDREEALPHYRAAAASPDRECRRRAQAALAQPLAPGEVAGRRLLAVARRERAAGRSTEADARAAEALAAWPKCREAALIRAEHALETGRGDARVPEIDEAEGEEPPWLVPWSFLLGARRADVDGRRDEAVRLYKEVLSRRRHRPDLVAAATAGLAAPFRSGAVPTERARPHGRVGDIDSDRDWRGFSRGRTLFNSDVHRLSLRR